MRKSEFEIWQEQILHSYTYKAYLNAKSLEISKWGWQRIPEIEDARQSLQSTPLLADTLVAIFTDGRGLFTAELEVSATQKQVVDLSRLATKLSKAWWSPFSRRVARQIHAVVEVYHSLIPCDNCSQPEGLLFPYPVLAEMDDGQWLCQDCHELKIYRSPSWFSSNRPTITFNHRYLPQFLH